MNRFKEFKSRLDNLIHAGYFMSNNRFYTIEKLTGLGNAFAYHFLKLILCKCVEPRNTELREHWLDEMKNFILDANDYKERDKSGLKMKGFISSFYEAALDEVKDIESYIRKIKRKGYPIISEFSIDELYNALKPFYMEFIKSVFYSNTDFENENIIQNILDRIDEESMKIRDRISY